MVKLSIMLDNFIMALVAVLTPKRNYQNLAGLKFGVFDRLQSRFYGFFRQARLEVYPEESLFFDSIFIHC